MEEFQTKLQESISELLQTKVGAIMTDLTEIDELLDTNEKLEEISDDLLDSLLEEPKIKQIDLALKKLINRL